ncbi:hypothetical protein [Paraliobacillus sp. JSM ZJ581]|uniref:hypothetical protein n=1 Tax=Paraliobacillus sp. JSM ZJ581 TaxID=3342118 RepID=UPI0035A91B9B
MSIVISSYNAYRQIQHNRSKKKRKLYKLAFGVAFDKVILAYCGFFMIMGLMIAYDTLLQFQSFFQGIENYLSNHYYLAIFFVVMRAVSLSFTRPGVLFSSAELMLSMLPYQRNQLWYYCAIDKHIRLSLYVILVTIVLKVFTSFSFIFLSMMLLLFITTQWLMIIPQWLLYQQSWLIKMVVIIVMGFVFSIFGFVFSFLTAQAFLVGFIIISLFIINLLFWKRIFQRVNWQTIVETNDKLIWNMFFINRMSEIKIQPPKRKGLFHHYVRNKRLKRPFPIDASKKVYDRLLLIYFSQHKDQLIKGVGGILVVMIAPIFKSEQLFGIGMAISIFLYAQISVSFFIGLFQEKLIYSLPWQIDRWKQAFLKWIYVGGGCLLLIAGIILLIITESFIWFPVQLLFFAMVAHACIQMLLREKINTLTKTFEKIPMILILWLVLLFFSVIKSLTTPPVSLLAVVLIWMIIRKKREKN